jgi:hypothetical protein
MAPTWRLSGLFPGEGVSLVEKNSLEMNFFGAALIAVATHPIPIKMIRDHKGVSSLCAVNPNNSP